ncbi:MAG: VWA domain-containing protein [Anaerolineae bacterium]|nr:VWA domain-containing protein [Anaerolineae bacterium]
MAFTQPLFLLLLIILPYFVYLGWPKGRYGRGRAWAALVLRCLIVLFAILSLAGVQSVHGGDELAVVFLVDVSDSVSEAEQEQALAFVEETVAALRSDDRAALVLFGADALVERPMMAGVDELGEIASIPRTYQTDLEGAIRLGMALFPAGAARRMVILSDGLPTLGEAEQAVHLARSQGIRVDVLPLSPPLAGGGEGGVEAWLSSLTAPDRLHQGEEFTLVVTARATDDVDAVLTVLAGDEVVAQRAVHLNPGDNTFAVPLTAGEPGFAPFRAYLAPAGDVYAQNNALSAFSLVEGPPRVLLVLPPEGGDLEGGQLLAALRAAGLEVTETTTGALPSDPAILAEYASIVLVNTPAKDFSPRALAALQSYVRDLGGGLVAVGGPNAYGVGGWYSTPLEETLPVDMTIHDTERFPPMAIVVVIDKSGSMSAQEGGVQKIRLAGEAAARVAELISDLDEITVIAFDDRPADVIGPLPGSQRDEVIDDVIRLQAGGGGIYVREGLQTALRYLEDSDKTVRHIILLADGSDSEHQEGVRDLVEERIAGQGITLSSVAIGAGQDLRFLEDIAELGGGRYYFTDRAASLPVIFAEETQLAMRSYIVEEPFYPALTAVSPILTGIDAVPQLAGYVATTPKPAGRVILTTHQNDPLLAAWQYGLGRAVAWTSDATGRWAQQWVTWDEFSRFWAQVVRWTIVERAEVPVDLTVTMEGEVAYVTVDAQDEDGAFVNGLDAGVSIVGPDGNPVQVDLAQTAPGRYEGTFTPQAEGAYVMRLTATSPPEGGGLEGGEVVLALTTGWVMGYSPEYAALEGDPTYLAGLAEAGGGAVLTEPAEAIAHNIRGVGVRRDLWPYLLALAALLLPFDVGVRRLALGRRDFVRMWEWVLARLPGRRPTAEAPSPVGRLFQAKARTEARRLEAQRPAGEATPPRVAPPASAERPAIPAEPPSRPAALASPAAEGETLAGRLLRKRRGREEEDE